MVKVQEDEKTESVDREMNGGVRQLVGLDPTWKQMPAGIFVHANLIQAVAIEQSAHMICAMS